MSVTERIEQLLLERGVHRRQVKRKISNTCGVRYETVRQWFNGTIAEVGANYLLIIADKWDANFDWLYTGKGSMEKPKISEEAASYLPEEKRAWLELFDNTSDVERAYMLNELKRFRKSIQNPYEGLEPASFSKKEEKVKS
ncbi:predicted transcriptional regulator [Hahella chejuensis KCTC 2396]|uniref:Predicted transcriptional regulator n=1 Tax=Hahella chejuensis (strain KCTC 2396) TaxID=349521 RepID=Q2SEA3_HAHCH|nr:transcriptional regulator [Hahella chejuensis]ABC31021.1 predicted transcriptional regulator [Hahella chejuensis KCTC 2396]